MNMDTAPPTVSVCVATFNQAQYLERCIESIFAQRAVLERSLKVEVIVGDDCSTDTTSIVLEELQRQHSDSLVVVRHVSNVGPASNYLSILSRASGDYIAHLDGDDYWEEEKLGAQIEYLEQHPHNEAVCTNARVVDKDEIECGVFTNVASREIDLSYLTASGNFLNHSSLLYRRVALSTVLGLAPPFVDYAIMIALSHRAPIGYIGRPLVCYRAGLPGSIQRTHGTQVQDLYLGALLSALPLVGKDAARKGAANYVAYRFVFALRGKAAHLDGIALARLARLARSSRISLTISAATRACLLAAKAFSTWAARKRRGGPFVHHPRY
ncbi:Putative glycosyltransferase EpsE [Variovorax sp. WDL1]|nr:putative glycosyltransferase EpsE [Variovorax sp. B4]PNG61823.1 putative glycosyltransferase EpsE [Variovorax sp. B2]VTV12114.1 Putative glycosyltransferase EpsE [Variovorax sp. WDL1]